MLLLLLLLLLLLIVSRRQAQRSLGALQRFTRSGAHCVFVCFSMFVETVQRLQARAFVCFCYKRLPHVHHRMCTCAAAAKQQPSSSQAAAKQQPSSSQAAPAL